MITGGELVVNNKTESGTGSGGVLVKAGRLSGSGVIAGAVTVGTGSGTGAVLGKFGGIDVLTIQSGLTLNADATYDYGVDSTVAMADQVIANGVTINSGAQFSIKETGNTSLPPGYLHCDQQHRGGSNQRRLCELTRRRDHNRRQ